MTSHYFYVFLIYAGFGLFGRSPSPQRAGLAHTLSSASRLGRMEGGGGGARARTDEAALQDQLHPPEVQQ